MLKLQYVFVSVMLHHGAKINPVELHLSLLFTVQLDKQKCNLIVTGCGCSNKCTKKDLMKFVLISINTRNPLKITLIRDKDYTETEG